MALPTQNLDFVSLNSDASRSDPVLVTLDGVTIAKTRFLVTKLGSILMGRTVGRTDGRTDAHTWFFWRALHNKPFGQKWIYILQISQNFPGGEAAAPQTPRVLPLRGVASRLLNFEIVGSPNFNSPLNRRYVNIANAQCFYLYIRI